MDIHGIVYFSSLVFIWLNAQATLLNLLNNNSSLIDMIIGPVGALIISIIIGYNCYKRWDKKEKELNKLKDKIIEEQKAEIEKMKQDS